MLGAPWYKEPFKRLGYFIRRNFMTTSMRLNWEVRAWDKDIAEAQRDLRKAKSEEERLEFNDLISGYHFLQQGALEDLELFENKKLVRRAIDLELGGLPPNGGKYYYEGATIKDLLSPEGIKYLRDKIREEERARREVWKDRAIVISGLTGLGGVAIGIISVSC